MSGPGDEQRRRQRQQWSILALLLLVVGLVVAALRWRAHAEIEAAERERLDGEAQTIEHVVGQQLRAVHGALRALRTDLAERAPAVLADGESRHMKALVDAVPGMASIVLLGADGRVRAASLPSLLGRDLAQRLPPPADPETLQVRPPLRDAAGNTAVDVALPVAGGGALVATLNSDDFRIVLRSALYAADVRAGITHAGGGLLMFEPQASAGPGRSLALLGPFFELHRDSGREANLFSGPIGRHGEERMIAVRSLRPAGVLLDAPLVLSVSRRLDDVYAAWRQQTALNAALYALLAAGLAALLAQLQRRQRALQAVQREAAARERDEAARLELALRGADLGLWDHHVPSARGTVDARWSGMLGYTPEVFERDTAAWQSLIHPDDRAQVVAARRDHLEGRTDAYEAVYRMRHRDGHWVWILDRGKVLERAADGAPLRMVGTHMDISHRMAADQALRRSEQSLATTLHSIGDAVIATDEGGAITRLNAAAERLTGWPAAEALGRPLADVFRTVDPDGGRPAPDPVQRALAAGSAVALAHDMVLVGRAGDRIPIADSAAPIRGADGQTTGVVLVFSDVSERQRAERALRASEQKSRALLEHLPTGVIVHAADGSVVEANPAACRLLGLSLAQMRGEAPVDPRRLVVGDDGEPMPPELRPAQRALATGAPVTNLVGGVYIPGRERPRWFLLNAFPVRDGGGAVEQVVCTLFDITEQRQADLDRRALEARLREAQKMESIGTLAGGIAHDFNNILAAILGNVALAREDVGAAHPVQSSLEQIQKAGLRARSLVQQILAFSRREPGTLAVQPLRPIVEETLAMLRATLPAAVRLDAQLGDAPVRVRADATQLQQVLMNLATNAWHALPAQGGRIEIGVERIGADAGARPRDPGLEPGPLAHLWVRDDGSGMDAATLARIFDPFFTTKPVGQGTGLGLSVVHGIVRAHAGAIHVDSAPGAGTTFHLYLPSPDLGGAELAPDPVADGAGTGRGQHVLYVDDDEVMVAMAERLLQRAGYRVTCRTSVRDALALLAGADGNDIDLVVTDFNMPEQSGLELAHRSGALRPGLAVVLTTGLVSEGLREQARAVGVRAVLNKENSFEELAATVARVLAEGGSAGS